MQTYVMKKGENNFSRMLQSTENGTWTKGEQHRTYKKHQQHKPDNTIVQNNIQIVLEYQTTSLNCV